jgi:hypothetical protein
MSDRAREQKSSSDAGTGLRSTRRDTEPAHCVIVESCGCRKHCCRGRCQRTWQATTAPRQPMVVLLGVVKVALQISAKSAPITSIPRNLIIMTLSILDLKRRIHTPQIAARFSFPSHLAALSNSASVLKLHNRISVQIV